MISEKLGGIIEGFPRLNDVHPFHRDLYVPVCPPRPAEYVLTVPVSTVCTMRTI
jgi:NADH:ubiquinone oxidoreductase subunit B-like Fe-S oxidoreductase